MVAEATHCPHPCSQDFRNWSVFFFCPVSDSALKGQGFPAPHSPLPPPHPHPPNPQQPHPFSTQLQLLAGEFTVTFYAFPSTLPPTTTSIFNTATATSCWRVPSDIFVCNSCSGHHTSCNRSGKLGRRDRIRSASLSRKPLLINSKDPNAEVTIFRSTEKQVSKDWWTPAVLLFI